MEDKLKEIFGFLSSNRKYNKALQERFYNSVLLPFQNEKEKFISLLYHITNTQSQPRINNTAEFFKLIYNDLNSLSSFTSFVNKISPNQPINFESFYRGMLNIKRGWGQKTSALLTKSIYHLHNGQYSEKLKIWNDVPKSIKKKEKFYLPVDAVIIAIFYRLDKNEVWTFDNINFILNKNYKGEQIEIWDDLWFWGFISQKGPGIDRIFEWNENKYWALKESDKDKNVIREIKLKSEEFTNIILR